MPLIDEDTLRRLRGEAKPPSSSRSYYTTADRWADIERTMKRLGARSLNKFLDEAVDIFNSMLPVKEEQEKITQARARATAAKPNVERSHRSYYTTNSRWAVVDAALDQYEFRSSSAFLDAAVEYWLAFVEEEIPEGVKPSVATKEQLEHLAEATRPRKRKKSP
jgi:hypothetical protein